jgi:hypothetical protein
MLCQGGGKTNHKKQGTDADSYNQQNRSDDAADFASLGIAAPDGVHSARVHLFEVSGTHDPGRNGERGANDQAKDAENENKCAAMWFHIDSGFKTDFVYLPTPVHAGKYLRDLNSDSYRRASLLSVPFALLRGPSGLLQSG